jgi:NAD(P)-dependent dehydrogenase (short-subunit alcohol dehydrogenase family)
MARVMASHQVLPEGAFDGQRALVTGGGTGLGLAVATRLGRLGATIICASRDQQHHGTLLERGEEHGFRVLSRPLDVREPDQVRALVEEVAEELGGIDVLVNNAAGNFIRPALRMSPRAFATVIDIALNGVFYASREVGRVMERQGGGSIVNITAPYAFTGKPGVVHSACAKAGVDTMTRTLAAEWAAHGIRVNAVSPGPFQTAGAAQRLWPSEEIEEAIRKEIALGRFGDVEEVAEVVCYLASPAAGWITGAVWSVTGGGELPEPMGGLNLRSVRRRREPPSGSR